MAKSNALPPGRISGNLCVFSAFLVSGVVSTCGLPPAAGTVEIPVPGVVLGVKKIMSSDPQLAPRPAGASQRVKVAPPPTGTFFNFPGAKKPIHCPSGEKKGPYAPSVPAIDFTSEMSLFMSRTKTLPAPTAPPPPGEARAIRGQRQISSITHKQPVSRRQCHGKPHDRAL